MFASDTTYAQQTNGSSLYMELAGVSGAIFDANTMTFGGSGVRFSVGALAINPATTMAGATPGGMFALSGKTCTIVINNAVAQTAGVFQIFVDNNTSSSSASPLNTAQSSTNTTSRLVSGLLVAGDNTFTVTLPATANSDFFQIRGDKAASESGTVQLNYIHIDCI